MDALLKILREINPDVDFEHEEALMDDGIFDSLELVGLVVAIEEEFGVEIDAEEINEENFNSVQNIMKLIEKSPGK